MDDSPSMLQKLTSFFSRKNQYISDEVQNILDEREENNDPLTIEERKLMAAALQFYKMEASEVSIPRSEIIFLNAEDSFEKVMQVFKESKHSRLPVYGRDSDDVLGFITLKDIIQYVGNDAEFNLKKAIRPCPFVPDTSSTSYILKEMQRSRRQIAITVDEYGGTSGLITLKDILEELVGDIDDENDKEDKLMVMPLPGGKYRVDPRMDIEDLEERLGQKLFDDENSERDFDTIGGLVLNLARKVPEQGEEFTSGHGYMFKVVEANARRIVKLEVCPITEANNSDEN